MTINYCPSDYQWGDEHNPMSPWYEEPPEPDTADEYEN